MKNKIVSFLLILFLILGFNYDVKADSFNIGYQGLVLIDNEIDYNEDGIAFNFDDVKSNHVILYNLNDETLLYKKNSDEIISIASLTKIMTSLVVIENVDNLDEKVKISSLAFSDIYEYAKAGFKAGEVVTYRDILYGILLPSGAEAAQEAAIAVAGDIDSFVIMMNEEAEKLGLTNTHFSNPVGRDDEDNYSTLDDLAKLLLYALDNEIFYNIYTTRTYTTTNNLALVSTLVGPSIRYNLDIDNILGSKSGYTDDAGLCLSSIASYNDVNYLLITAGAPYAGGYPNHIIDTLDIYNYYFDNYSYREILSEGQELKVLNVKDSFQKNYIITSLEDVSVYLNNNIDLSEIEYRYKGVEYVDYKIKTGDKLGNIEVVHDNEILYDFDVYLTDDIRYKHTKLVILFLGLILFLILFIRRKKEKKRRRRRKNVKRSKR